MSRSTIGKLCLVVIAFQFLGFFIVTVVAGKDGVSDKKPFIAQIDEIAVSDSNVYTLDSTFRKICKYDLNASKIARQRILTFSMTKRLLSAPRSTLCFLRLIRCHLHFTIF